MRKMNGIIEYHLELAWQANPNPTPSHHCHMIVYKILTDRLMIQTVNFCLVTNLDSSSVEINVWCHSTCITIKPISMKLCKCQRCFLSVNLFIGEIFCSTCMLLFVSLRVCLIMESSISCVLQSCVLVLTMSCIISDQIHVAIFQK